jgi:hypothetical protein
VISSCSSTALCPLCLFGEWEAEREGGGEGEGGSVVGRCKLWSVGWGEEKISTQCRVLSSTR